MFRSILMVNLLIMTGYAQADRSAWQDIPNTQARSTTASALSQYRALQLDANLLRTQLSNATATTPVLIELPLPDSDFITLLAKPTQILSDTLAQQYPDIQTWSVTSPSSPTVSGVIDLSPSGFHAMLILANGERVFIDPDQTSPADNTQAAQRHLSFSQSDNASAFKQDWSCGAQSDMQYAGKSFTTMGNTLNALQARPEDAQTSANTVAARAGENLRTYRIAVAATSEYVTAHAGGNANAALANIASSIARVNQIYQRDLSIKLQLVSGTNIIYTNSATDPYTDNSAFTMMGQNQTNLDTVIGSANYDIGHVFGTTGGGIATVGGVCNTSNKARGVTGLPANITGDAFNIDYVAHEIGHQLSANHTFNSTKDVCSGGRVAGSAFEPGSGNTIMSYAGLCGADNLQNNSFAMFHSTSIEQITQFAHNGLGNACGTTSTLSNANPVVNAGADYTIPAFTPFTLTPIANSDANGDTLSYSWEQIDAGTASAVNVDTGNNALIRVKEPTSSPSRTIPQISDLINGTSNYGEVTPATTRVLNFRLQARDGKGGIAHDDIHVNVHNTGAVFGITAPTSTTTLFPNTTQSVQWNVAGTNQAPINCSLVDIAVTTDGGSTFSPLKAGTPNDGFESVNLPATLGTSNQIRVKCSNNIFFALSSSNPATSNQTTSSSSSDDSGSGGGGSFPLSILLLLSLTTYIARSKQG